MDMIYIFSTAVCCYRYDPYLRYRTQFINDRRLYPNRWTRSERRHYEEEKKEFYGHCRGKKELRGHSWWEHLFDENRAREPEKTLIEMRYERMASYVVEKRVEEGYFRERGDRLLCLSFFHSDEEMQFFVVKNPEDALKFKAQWLEELEGCPHINVVEIPYDFTLTEAYLCGLFKQFVLDEQRSDYT